MASSRISEVGALTGKVSQPNELTGQIVQQNIITGSVSTADTLVLTAEIEQQAQLEASISQERTLIGEIILPEIIHAGDGEIYNGDYIVTPKVNSQSLETKNKLMEDDMTVLAIPYFETSNLTGKTVYIGGE